MTKVWVVRHLYGDWHDVVVLKKRIPDSIVDLVDAKKLKYEVKCKILEHDDHIAIVAREPFVAVFYRDNGIIVEQIEAKQIEVDEYFAKYIIID